MSSEIKADSAVTPAAVDQRGGNGVFEQLRPFAYPVAVVLGTAVVLGGQLVEDLTDSPPLQMFQRPPDLALARWAVVVLVVYSMVMSAVLMQRAARSLSAVRPVIAIKQDAFDGYTHRLSHTSPRIEIGLFLASAVITLVVFLLLGSDLLLDDPVTKLPHKLPTEPLYALIVLAGYTVVGWTFLRLMYITGRSARILGQLSHEPLRINVFDTSDLIPFGNLGLFITLAPAAALIILLAGLGTPNALGGWVILGIASTFTMLALLLPLQGIHRQMADAKEKALTGLNQRIADLYDEISGPLPADADHASRIGGATTALIPMRKTVQEMTTWPFRSAVTFGRAVLIALAPLIYAFLSEVIRLSFLPK